MDTTAVSYTASDRSYDPLKELPHDPAPVLEDETRYMVCKDGVLYVRQTNGELQPVRWQFKA